MFTSYSIENDLEFKQKIDEALKKGANLKIPFKLIAADFYKSEKAIFQMGSRGQYPDLSTKPFRAFWRNKRGYAALYKGGYKEYKKVHYGFTYPILKAGGRLMESVTNPSHKDAILKIASTYMIIGTSVPYARYHQTGTKKMPMRKILFIGPEAGAQRDAGRLKRWVGYIDNHIKETLRSV